ncbi:hypothetical protein PIB30_002688 [Stylosanthes scabra]|uniref:Uncharacterized protein n=1 Tax=Stylosanthes scabra TaxID=79078 RepID=A0ABU6R249_9FABA|nr:hypothetical protein [Stylosanthes scabra]
MTNPSRIGAPFKDLPLANELLYAQGGIRIPGTCLSGLSSIKSSSWYANSRLDFKENEYTATKAWNNGMDLQSHSDTQFNKIADHEDSEWRPFFGGEERGHRPVERQWRGRRLRWGQRQSWVFWRERPEELERHDAGKTSGGRRQSGDWRRENGRRHRQRQSITGEEETDGTASEDKLDDDRTGSGNKVVQLWLGLSTGRFGPGSA